MRKLQLHFYGIMAIMLFIASCVGCANIHYISPTTGESFSYNRLGTQKISGFKMSKNNDGLVNVSFDTQEGAEGKMFGDLAEAIKNISAISKVP